MHVRTPLDLGLILRDSRRKLGLSQGELATRAGVGRQWLVAIEHGKARAEIGMVLRTLATYYHLNAAGGYSQKSFNLLSYKGQTIRVYFLGTEGSQVATSFVVDNVSVITK